MSFSKTIFISSIFFILGIAFASFFKIPSYLFFFFVFLFFFSKRLIFLLFFLSFLFGFFRFQGEFSKLEIEKAKLLKLKRVEIEGKVDSKPSKKENFQELILKIESLSGERAHFSGKVLIRTQKGLDFEYGEKLRITGRVSLAKDYLLKDKVLAIFYFPEIERKGKNFGNFLFRLAFFLREKFDQKLRKIFPDPHFGLMEAILFGEEKDIPKEILEKFNLTQTRHIAAVSGMNITLVSILVLEIFLFLGFWRHQAFFLTTFFIFFYLLMIGFPSSGVRAGLMGLLFLLAQYFGRLGVAERTLIFAIAIMLFFNPFLLKFDLSFQLSFLATLGLVYLYPIFLQIFKLPSFLELKKTFSATLAAQTYVLPLLILKFKSFYPFFILPNLLILPVLPILTFLAFFSVFFGSFWLPLGKFISYSALFLSNFIYFVVNFFSKFPTLSFSFSSPLFLPLSYFFLFLLTFFLKRKFGQPIFLR